MNKRTEMKKDSMILFMILGIVLVLIFTWVNTSIHQLSYEGDYGRYSFLKMVLYSAFATGLYYWLATDDAVGPIRNTTKLCVVGTAISAILMLMALLLEIGIDEGFSLYGGKEIELCFFSVNKKYFYDFFAIVWYPYNLSVVLRALRKERFKGVSVFYSCIAIIGSTLSGIFIFIQMSNIYLVDLLVLNTITLAVGLWKYVIPEKTVHKGNVIAAIVLYAVTRIILLPLQCSDWGSSLSTFMLGDAYENYREAIRVIMSEASFFGTSEYLGKSTYVHEYLTDCSKPVLQLLYYSGWFSVLVLIVLMAAFVFVIVKLIGVKNGREHRGWLIFTTAAAMLVIRAIMGTFYSFGVLYPIGLPFMSNNGCLMDGMAFTLIIICAWENKKIRTFHFMKDKFVSADKYLGKCDSYTVKNELANPYEEEEYEDKVDVFTSEGKILQCRTEWYCIKGREFCVFTTKTFVLNKQHFILECADRKWIVLNDADSDIREEIIKRYKEDYSPDCMEREVSCSDEKDICEDFDMDDE